MPPRSIIETLPTSLRDELNRRLLASGYGDLEGQAEWLRAQGVQIGKSAVGEYSKGLKETIEKAMLRSRERLEIAKSLGAISDSDKAALLESTEMVLMDKLMDIMDDWSNVDPDARPKALAGLIRAASDLGGSARGTAKWRREFEAEVKRQAAEAAAKSAEAAGVSAETIARIRRDVLGMAA